MQMDIWTGHWVSYFSTTMVNFWIFADLLGPLNPSLLAHCPQLTLVASVNCLLSPSFLGIGSIDIFWLVHRVSFCRSSSRNLCCGGISIPWLAQGHVANPLVVLLLGWPPCMSSLAVVLPHIHTMTCNRPWTSKQPLFWERLKGHWSCFNFFLAVYSLLVDQYHWGVPFPNPLAVRWFKTSHPQGHALLLLGEFIRLFQWFSFVASVLPQANHSLSFSFEWVPLFLCLNVKEWHRFFGLFVPTVPGEWSLWRN